ncbi:MAG: hypothetical protein GTO63_30255 [Anaerolineae bacterium]|nr:hypothetical protein [Anaerolineae bacterium]NIN98988.1 hypothetical protein [Anaerolineae bacterium]
MGSQQLRRPNEDELRKVAARMRHRGFTNALFDEVSKAFEKANPGYKTVWEYAPPNSPDQNEVMMRQMHGFRLVGIDEIPEGVPTPHSQDSGEVRVSDCVMMCAPADVYDAYYAEDFKHALEDANLPKTEYLESLKQRGNIGDHKGIAYGGITESTEQLQVDMKKLTEGEET